MASRGGETDGKYEYIRVHRPDPALPSLPPEDATAACVGLRNVGKKYSIFTFLFCFVLLVAGRHSDDPCPPVGNRHGENTL